MNIVLKGFQERVREAIVEIVRDTAAKIDDAPLSRSSIASAQGGILVESPTASGKTITVARAIATLKTKLPGKCVWFWFSPFTELVVQTIEVLRSNCPEICARDPKMDREYGLCQDGDVFVSTWAAVSAKNKESLRMRTKAESVPSIDSFVERLRNDGWYVGVVVDEAHKNFNTAVEARRFYSEILKPDFTIMVTATPDDEGMRELRKHAKISEPSRLRVSRSEVVQERLNKSAVKAYYFRASEEDVALLDYDEVAIYAAVARHNEIKARLLTRGVTLTPLLLVQVENLSESLELAKRTLVKSGLPINSIAVHTSDEPDHALHTIAYDETKEALIFKLAVETGFDAPRAWSLVSLRSTKSVTSGIQAIGRIMRVHPKLQGSDFTNDSILDCGHVFLADAASQIGLTGAADRIRAIEAGTATVTDNVQIFEFSNGKVAITDPNGGFLEAMIPNWRTAADSMAQREMPDYSAESLPELSFFAASLFDTIDEMVSGSASPRPSAAHNSEATARNEGNYHYALRSDISLPKALLREEFTGAVESLVQCIADRVPFDDSIIALSMRSLGKVEVTEDDLFERVKVITNKGFAISMERVENAAQLAFQFNDRLDQRELKPALVDRLRRELVARGAEPPAENILRRTIDLALYLHPNMLRNACKECMGRVLETREGDPIPATIWSDVPLKSATRGVYAVFGERMRDWETRFAAILDSDSGGTITWWLKNVENTRWACKIVRPNGRNYFPDFIIGVNGRKKPNHIALAEVKYDIHSDDSIDKVRTDHLSYGTALMVTWDVEKKKWYVVGYDQAIDRNRLIREFNVNELRIL